MACLPIGDTAPTPPRRPRTGCCGIPWHYLPLVVVFLGHAGSYVYRFISNLGDVMPARRAEAAGTRVSVVSDAPAVSKEL